MPLIDDVREAYALVDDCHPVIVAKDGTDFGPFAPADNYDILAGWAADVLSVAMKEGLTANDISALCLPQGDADMTARAALNGDRD